MNQSVLSRIEAGKRRVSATELEQIAAALEVDLRALLSGSRARPGRDLAPPVRAPPSYAG